MRIIWSRGFFLFLRRALWLVAAGRRSVTERSGPVRLLLPESTGTSRGEASALDQVSPGIVRTIRARWLARPSSALLNTPGRRRLDTNTGENIIHERNCAGAIRRYRQRRETPSRLDIHFPTWMTITRRPLGESLPVLRDVFTGSRFAVQIFFEFFRTPQIK